MKRARLARETAESVRVVHRAFISPDNEIVSRASPSSSRRVFAVTVERLESAPLSRATGWQQTCPPLTATSFTLHASARVHPFSRPAPRRLLGRFETPSRSAPGQARPAGLGHTCTHERRLFGAVLTVLTVFYSVLPSNSLQVFVSLRDSRAEKAGQRAKGSSATIVTSTRNISIWKTLKIIVVKLPLPFFMRWLKGVWISGSREDSTNTT